MAGEQCPKRARWRVMYHGDGELYGYSGPEPKWVGALFCDDHRGKRR